MSGSKLSNKKLTIKRSKWFKIYLLPVFLIIGAVFFLTHQVNSNIQAAVLGAQTSSSNSKHLGNDGASCDGTKSTKQCVDGLKCRLSIDGKSKCLYPRNSRNDGQTSVDSSECNNVVCSGNALFSRVGYTIVDKKVRCLYPYGSRDNQKSCKDTTECGSQYCVSGVCKPNNFGG